MASKGVYYHKHSDKWIARIVIPQKSLHIGYFKTEKLARIAHKNRIKQMANEPTPQIDVSVIEFLKAQGLGSQVADFEKKYGVNLGKIEEALDTFITHDKACLEIKEQARKLTMVDDAVLIHGETGTGKELLAKVLGANRKAGRFVAVNVAAIPRELVESTLFGYAKGSFTGANKESEGLIQYAGEGTLFLDEIGDLDFTLQAKFLRVLQDRKVRRVGGLDEEEVKCRFVAASHFDLKEQVSKKLFRLDLYARLSTFILSIPPLRDRLGDIPHIMAKLNPKFPCDKVQWDKVDLSLNIRSLQQYASRYKVFNKLP